MTITADTITDAQISALWRHACGTGLVDVDPDTMHECNVALNHHHDFTDAEQRAARARCAEILNARNGTL